MDIGQQLVFSAAAEDLEIDLYSILFILLLEHSDINNLILAYLLQAFGFQV